MSAPQNPDWDRIQDYDKLFAALTGWERMVSMFGPYGPERRGYIITLWDGREIPVEKIVSVNWPGWSLDLETDAAALALSCKRIKELRPNLKVSE